MKKCNRCQEVKENSDFNFRNKAKGYLSSFCKICVSVRYKNYRLENKDQMNERMRSYRTDNNEKINDWERKYRKDKYASDLDIRKKALVRRNKRRAKEASASFKNFSKEIKEIYKNCPKGYHVDHIIPLSHPLMCGLHVPWNLQYLSAQENLKKSNKIKE